MRAFSFHLHVYWSSIILTVGCPQLSLPIDVAITYSTDANTNANYVIGTSASFVCTVTGDGLNGVSNVMCELDMGGPAVDWSDESPTCNGELLHVI